MALSDLVLKSKINMAIARDVRFARLPLDVRVEDGNVTLAGNLSIPSAASGLQELVQNVEGVGAVRNELQQEHGRIARTADDLTQALLHKLESEFQELPDQNALTQADYLRWALWTIYKYHIPETVEVADVDQAEADATEQALAKIASLVQVPKALLAMEMLRQADAINESPISLIPDSGTPTLTSSPMSLTNEQPDANSHINRAGV